MNEFLNRIATLSPDRLALLALELQDEVDRLKQAARQPIAIIGMGCRFPGGADSPRALWQLLREGRDAIVPAPSDRWNLDKRLDFQQGPVGHAISPHGGFLERADLFDPLFFGISPREAQMMDPQQRLLLEVAWEALEDAGLSADAIHGSRTAVYLGVSGNDFLLRLFDQDPSHLDALAATGSSLAVAAGRLAYTLHLTGPCLSIDTSCSSSLVAVATACDSLRAGRANLALAGGVSLILSSETTAILARGGMLSADFRCKAFDAAADGFVRGEGCGLVVLKRLRDAERDGDRILAVIRGTAVNQDGRSSGLTAPSGPAQQALLREALSDADLKPSQVQFVEAHGTGTSLGDPIEAQALAAVFGRERPVDQPLLVGSIKTNFGHLEAAAGIAGLMKLVLAIEVGEIPPLLHLKTPNPHVEWSTMPLAFPTRLVPWPGECSARAGGVSSFGFSGTNAHVLVTAAPNSAKTESPVERPQHLLCLSAKSDPALRTLAKRYADELAENRNDSAANVCFTANCGRVHHEHRLAVVGSTNQQISERLLMLGGPALHPKSRVGKVERSRSPDIAFLFTGQGSQHPGMSRELYRTQPSFRATLDRCDEVLRDLWGRRLVDILFSDDSGKAALINQTAFTQPALFAVEFALAELLKSWGVMPGAVLGHSVGEYVAACVAGIFPLEAGLKLISARARLMQSLPTGGGMVAVLAGERDVLRAIAPFSKTLSIAAFNGPTNVVVSGPLGVLGQFTHRLEALGLPYQSLAVSHAFHSALLDPILGDLERAAEHVPYAEPRYPIISNLTGHPAVGTELRSAAYWRTHARQPVRFAASMQALRDLGYKIFIEVGPAPVLSGMARRFMTDADCRWLPTLRSGRGDWEQLLETVGELYVSGVNINWVEFDRDYQRRKLSLPTYPFQRSRYWPEIKDRRPPGAGHESSDDNVGAYRDWLYELEWQPVDLASSVGLPSFVPSTRELQKAGTVAAAAAYQDLPPADDEVAYRDIDLLCRDYIVEALVTLGHFPSVDDLFSTDELRRRLGVLDRHSCLFERLLAILAEDGILDRHAKGWIVAQAPAPKPTEPQLQAVSARHPQCAAELAVLGPCGRNLANVLSGLLDPMQLLFPDGSFERIARLYYEARPVALFNILVERCLTETAQRLPADRALRILEIGAGTGATTARVLRHLPADRTRYMFTDISPQFIERARQRFSDYVFVDYQRFDLDESASEQGLSLETFDVVIVANAIHATRDLRRSLHQIRQLLNPDGLLVLLEVVRPQRLGDLTVGLTAGWWSFTDTDLRPDYPLISEHRWLELLSGAGFVEPAFVPGPAINKTGLFANQSVFLAKKPSRAATASSAGGRWLVWADGQGIGQRLAAGLRERGDDCVVVSRGNQFQSLGNGQFRIRPNSPADHAQVVEAFRGSDPAQCRAAAYLWGLDASIDEESGLTEVQAAVERACHGALLAVQSLARAGGAGDVSVAFVTRGGQPAAISIEQPQPAQAALWGLAGVVALEHPELHCRRIDLGGDAGDDHSAALLKELLRSDFEATPIALRGNARCVLRLKRAAASDLRYSAYPLRSDGNYLVTGGLGGLGLETAGWLVERGARHLVLVGRSPPGEQAQAAIARWGKAGVEVNSIAADIGDKADAARVFAIIESLPFLLRGVVHSAGVLDDALVLRQDWSRFERVLRAKVGGAWNLHSHTRSSALDFFVLFSSGASLLGSAGQANHAAANAFLDGLAIYRRFRQLPGLSINWGAWRDAGAAKRHDVLERFAQAGVKAIDLRNGLKALECLLAANASRAAVLPIDWATFTGSGTNVGGSMLFARFRKELWKNVPPTFNSEIKINMPQWRDKLRSAPPTRHQEIVEELVNREAANILGLRSFQAIDARQPLQELGLDSLMALQLRNTLSAWTGIQLPPTLLYNCPTVEELVRHLTECFGNSRMSAGSSAKSSQLSDDE